MAKNYRIRQTATIKGKKETSTFELPWVDESDVTAFCALLEGGYEVIEINTALSNVTKAETNVTDSTPVSLISLRGEKGQTVYISPFGSGKIHFKNSVSADNLKGLFANKKVYQHVPDASVVSVGIRTSEATI